MISVFFGVIIIVVVVDLITKFTIEGILNPGIAWGLGAELPWLWILVVIFSFVLAAVLIVWFCRCRKRTWLMTMGLGLLIGGALGNAIDRLVSDGAVHDFIDFVLFRNNIADIALSVGAVCIMLALIAEVMHASR